MVKNSKAQTIASALKKQILDESFGADGKLPSERQLTEMHNIARATAREAIRILENEGLVEAVHGKGVFVRSKKKVLRFAGDRYQSKYWRESGLSPFRIEVAQVGGEAKVELPTIDVVDDKPEIHERLNLDTSIQLVERTNHYFVDGEIIQIGITYIPLSTALDTPLMTRKLGPGSLYARFEDAGHVLTHIVEEISARMPSLEERETLKMSPATPLIDVLHTGIDQDESPFEVTRFLLPSDRHVAIYKMTVN